LYRSEEIETTCSAIFMNAYCNYPLLVGQQTNLYKCVLENGFSLMSDEGFMGLLHPETIYDDPKGQPLRKEIYPRLRYHFQYTNELCLFAEVDHHTKYGKQIYGSYKNEIDFHSIHNLFHPNTIDGCFAHDGHGICGGIKDENGNWNVNAHKDRIVRFTETELQVLCSTFENGDDVLGTKLVSIHSKNVIFILQNLSRSSKHLRDVTKVITEGMHNTGAVMDGMIKRVEDYYPSSENYEMVFSGPHFYVGTPVYKTPYSQCLLNSDYDIIDLTKECVNPQRTNYCPNIPLQDYLEYVKGLNYILIDDEPLKPTKWIDNYRVAYRNMLGPSAERTLVCCIIPPRTSHIHTVCSVEFLKNEQVVELCGLSISSLLDFYTKTIGASNLSVSRLDSFPLGIADKYKQALFSRTLLLNCLTTAYADLWHEMWNEQYKQESWSITDDRLKPFDQLHDEWSWDIPLRNYFERRMALVEIDVISAMALGLSLEDLEMIYNIQFPVLQQNENDTWYDAKGNMVFTCSKGLTGVGLDRPAWNAMRGEAITNDNGETVGYKGTEPTYIHTIDPAKSELYGGQQVTYYAPYTKCDRTEDYRRAWAHFEKIFNN